MTAGWGAVARWSGSFTAKSDVTVGEPGVSGREWTFDVSGSFALAKPKSSPAGQLPVWQGVATVAGTHTQTSWGMVSRDGDGTFRVDERCPVSFQIDPNGGDYFLTIIAKAGGPWRFDDPGAQFGAATPLPNKIGPLSGSMGSGGGDPLETWELNPAGAAAHLSVDAISTSMQKLPRGHVHCISDVPEMPDIRVTTQIRELSAAEEAAVARRVRVEVSYKRVSIKAPTTEDRVFIPGPDATGWHDLPAGGGTDWVVSWPKEFCGGKLEVFAEASVEGIALSAHLPREHSIEGLNATRDAVRKHLHSSTLPDVSVHVVPHRESHFIQFGKVIKGALPIHFTVGPDLVLAAADAGFGIGQLTDGPPSIDQLWNWLTNVEDIVPRLESARGNAEDYVRAVQAGTVIPRRAWGTGKMPPIKPKPQPGAPSMTADQLDLEMWSRYNSGWRYHNYHPKTKTWERRIPVPAPPAKDRTGCGYADGCMAVRHLVENGSLPPGWA